MVDTPWKTFAKADQNRGYLALISYLPLKHLWHVPSFISLSRAIQRQLAESSGLIGYSVRAKIISKNFLTLSVWEDQKALGEFVRNAPHSDAMGKLKSRMRQTKFARWQVSGEAIPPSWNEAIDRLQKG